MEFKRITEKAGLIALGPLFEASGKTNGGQS
jgi:hypothetical protein